MKNLNKSPLVWFFAVIILGYVAIENNSFEWFIVFVLAVVLSKQIQIISQKD